GPSTMTFAATLVLMAALARSLAGRDPAPTADAEAAAVAAGRLVADPERTAGALTLKEAARFPAESLQAAQFRHGPLELAGPSWPQWSSPPRCARRRSTPA